MSRVLYNNQGITIQLDEKKLLMQGPFGSIAYDIDSGFSAFSKTGETTPVIEKIHAETELDGKKIQSCTLSRETEPEVCTHADCFGEGVKVTVTNRGPRLAIVQNYYIYPQHKYILLDAVLVDGGGLSVNYIAPLKAGLDGEKAQVVQINPADDPRFLFVPFDNDEFVRYDAKKIPVNAESYEVTAVYDNNSRNGFVTGSVTHDTWKTGIRIAAEGKTVNGFSVFGGITSFETRDTEDSETNKEVQPHGMVSGGIVTSPKIFLGCFDDWRDGLEEYGRANGLVAPPLAWSAGPPFGWNSWSAVAFDLTYDIYTGASDFLKDSLPHFTNGSNPVYINFDATKVSGEEKNKAADHVYRNKQIPGTYHTPFACWHKDIEKTKENGPESAGSYTWYDLILKDSQGNPLKYMHGKGWPLDPTHPGTVAHNDWTMKKIQEGGFRYVKLDFLSHGAMEGAFYDKNITTGIQAYNYGLQKLVEALGDDIQDEKFFISLSIAPVFPAQYAHGRRISCDVFGEISWAEYQLNSLNYGWWLHNAVYPYNDPDHIVVYTSYNRAKEKGPILAEEGLSRYIAAAITGGFMINSDYFDVPGAGERAVAILNNAEVNALAASGRTFRPVEGNTGSQAGTLYIRDDRAIDGCFYIAAFNFSDSKTGSVQVDFARIGLEPDKKYSLRELISGKDQGTVSGSLAVTMGIAEPKLFRFK